MAQANTVDQSGAEIPIAVDMDVRADRVKIIDRLCELSGCRHVYVPYNDDNEIVKIVVSLL